MSFPLLELYLATHAGGWALRWIGSTLRKRGQREVQVDGNAQVKAKGKARSGKKRSPKGAKSRAPRVGNADDLLERGGRLKPLFKTVSRNSDKTRQEEAPARSSATAPGSAPPACTGAVPAPTSVPALAGVPLATVTSLALVSGSKATTAAQASTAAAGTATTAAPLSEDGGSSGEGSETPRTSTATAPNRSTAPGKWSSGGWSRLRQGSHALPPHAGDGSGDGTKASPHHDHFATSHTHSQSTGSGASKDGGQQQQEGSGEEGGSAAAAPVAMLHGTVVGQPGSEKHRTHHYEQQQQQQQGGPATHQPPVRRRHQDAPTSLISFDPNTALLAALTAAAGGSGIRSAAHHPPAAADRALPPSSGPAALLNSAASGGGGSGTNISNGGDSGGRKPRGNDAIAPRFEMIDHSTDDGAAGWASPATEGAIGGTTLLSSAASRGGPLGDAIAPPSAGGLLGVGVGMPFGELAEQAVEAPVRQLRELNRNLTTWLNEFLASDQGKRLSEQITGEMHSGALMAPVLITEELIRARLRGLVSVHAKRLALFYGLRVAVASAELQLLKVLVRRLMPKRAPQWLRHGVCYGLDVLLPTSFFGPLLGATGATLQLVHGGRARGPAGALLSVLMPMPMALLGGGGAGESAEDAAGLEGDIPAAAPGQPTVAAVLPAVAAAASDAMAAAAGSVVGVAATAGEALGARQLY